MAERSIFVTIKDILFDLGRVLVPFDWEIALRKLRPHLAPDLEQLSRTDEKVFSGLFIEDAVDLEMGKIEFDQFHGRVSEKLNLPLDVERFRTIWCDIFRMDEEMVSLGESLSGRYRTWLASNTSRVHYEWILDRFPRVAFYRAAALSYELGVMKPSQRYYEKAVQYFGIEPHTAVFIDDLEENVEGSVRAGMHGIRFQTRNQLVEELRRLGVTGTPRRE
jgi:glucose-1-phosphatase